MRPTQRLTSWAPLGLAALWLGGWLWWQASHVGAYIFDFDEGVHLVQARLVQEGADPYREMGLLLPPFWFWTAAAAFAIFGQTVEVARLLSLAYGAVGGVSVALLGRRLGGAWGGTVALVLYTLTPGVLWLSRAAMLEVPAISVALLALAVAAHARRPWAWWLAGVLFGVSLLIKAVVPAGLVALGWLAWRRADRRRGALAALLVGVAMPVGAVALLYGPGRFWHYTVAIRAAMRAVEPWSPAGNADKILEDGLLPVGATLVLAGLGLWATCGRPTAQALGLLWGASLVAAFFHTPLRATHLVVLGVSATPLAGGIVHVAARPAWRQGGRRLLWPLLGGLLAWQLASTVVELAPTYADTYKLDDTKVRLARYIAEHVPEGEYVVIDYPMIAFRAGRSVPPLLSDPSNGRIQSGYLTPEMAIEATAQAKPRLIVFWSGRLRQLEAYVRWIEERYRVVRYFGRSHPVYGLK